jgi:hypothetical protein
MSGIHQLKGAGLPRNSRPDAAGNSCPERSGALPFPFNFAAAFHAWKRRHIWPLLCFACTFAILYSISGADRFNDWEHLGEWLLLVGRSALLAIPISLAADIAFVAAWWIAVRARLLFAQLAARRASAGRRTEIHL